MTTEAAPALRRVLVLADGRKEGVKRLVPDLQAWLAERVERVQVEIEGREYCRARSRRTQAADAAEHPDLVVVLGGDGSILAVARAFEHDPVPTFGINFGRVGFLAATQDDEWEEGLVEVLEGRARIEPRTRIAMTHRPRKGEPIRAVALNEVTVQRAAHQGMLEVMLRVDEHAVTTYRADGLILATPSGSTAHSLAAGGPVLAPSIQGFVVTPICPQGLSHRPIVVSEGARLELSLTATSGLTTIVVDGQGYYPMRQGERVVLERHPVPFPLLARPSLDPYKRLRDRLGWRGSLEPDVFPGEAATDGDFGSASKA